MAALRVSAWYHGNFHGNENSDGAGSVGRLAALHGHGRPSLPRALVARLDLRDLRLVERPASRGARSRRGRRRWGLQPSKRVGRLPEGCERVHRRRGGARGGVVDAEVYERKRKVGGCGCGCAGDGGACASEKKFTPAALHTLPGPEPLQRTKLRAQRDTRQVPAAAGASPGRP